MKVIDCSDGKAILVMDAGTLVHVEHDGAQFLVSHDGVFIGSFAGPIRFRPDDPANLFRLESIRRTFGTTQRPLYRGAMEVARGSTTAGLAGPPRLNVLNIVEVEGYVPGVVANESIASFTIAALRAQAVAARGYAIANIGNYVNRGYPFDIVDSSASQVYRGVISEHVNAVRAATETLRAGCVGGRADHLRHVLVVFWRPQRQQRVDQLLEQRETRGSAAFVSARHLRRRGSGAGLLDSGRDRLLLALAAARDSAVLRRLRLHREWILPLEVHPAGVGAQDTAHGRPANSALISGTRTGPITNVEITERSGSAQRAIVARVTLTTGVLEVRGWESLRQTIGRTNTGGTPRACGTSTIAASFVLNSPSALDVANNPDGTVGNLTVSGGGWGHNLGMSQYGAHGRGKAGFSFIEILKAYYTGVDVGSYPIDIGREPGSGPPTLRQQFAAPNAEGTLQIRAEDLRGLRVHINALHDLSFDEAALSSGLVRWISRPTDPGLNVIQYNPVGRGGRATVNVVVR